MTAVAPGIWSPLAEGRKPQTYEPGQFIYQQGETPSYFYYLVSGSARSILTSESGGERILTNHHPGDLMGEASFFDECPRVTSNLAVTRCQVVSIDRERLDRVFRAHPDLALPMLQYLSRTVRMLSGHVDGMSFLRADQRVARQLLTLAESGPVTCTHEELGFSVGVSRVTVSRVLREFASKGWVDTGYRMITLSDRDALRDLVLEV
ncbi:MAG: Crp/Fnr family transcriptional regulator [Clostridia bacterium]|nr:Crp/Fnr family transcriptional regulator [Clostridia bacterium]